MKMTTNHMRCAADESINMERTNNVLPQHTRILINAATAMKTNVNAMNDMHRQTLTLQIGAQFLLPFSENKWKQIRYKLKWNVKLSEIMSLNIACLTFYHTYMYIMKENVEYEWNRTGSVTLQLYVWRHMHVSLSPLSMRVDCR